MSPLAFVLARSGPTGDHPRRCVWWSPVPRRSDCVSPNHGDRAQRGPPQLLRRSVWRSPSSQ